MMTVRSARRGYLLTIVVIALLVLAVVVAAMATLGLSDAPRALAFAVLGMVVLYLLRGMWIFGLAFLESPRFSIEATRGQLVIRNGRKEIRISSADVPVYYVYNNKIVFAAPLIGQDTIRPFVYVRAGQVTLYLYLLEDAAKILRTLAAFDPEFVAKNKWNLGMVIQVIGMGISPP